MKGKSSSSHASAEFWSVTFDVEDESGEGNVAPHLAEFYSPHVRPEAVQQREPKRSRIDRKTQTSFERFKDFRTEHERSSHNVPDKTDVTGKEDVKETEADVLESTQDIPGVEEKKKPRNTQGSKPEHDDPPDDPECVGELDDEGTDDDVGIMQEHTGEDGEQIKLKDKVVETTKEETDEDNPEKSCSEEPDVDFSSKQSQHTQRFISSTRDDRVRKRESRSLRNLKVLQAFVVTQLKW